MMSSLPKSVRVGPHDIRFRQMEAAEEKDDFGYFKTDALEISLCKEYAAGTLAVDTVLHELLHAVWFVALKETAAEEHVCTVMATQLTQIIRDNPELIAWLQETVRK